MWQPHSLNAILLRKGTCCKPCSKRQFATFTSTESFPDQICLIRLYAVNVTTSISALFKS